MELLRLRIFQAAVVTLLVVVSGCSDPGPDARWLERVGDLSDRSYGDLRGAPARVNAVGAPVRVEQFAGKFVWVEYAAPWCSSCGNEVSEVRQADAGFGDDVAFLTVMTSDMGGYGDPATQRTAAAWASAHGLDASRVVAADLTSMTVPRHLMFSPEGQMLYVKTGFLPAGAIREIITERKNGWNRWYRGG